MGGSDGAKLGFPLTHTHTTSLLPLRVFLKASLLNEVYLKNTGIYIIL